MEDRELAVSSPENDNPLVRAMLADKDGVIVSRRCALCKSPHRKKIEEMYDQQQSIPAIKKFLDSNNEVHDQRKVKYHFEAHYKTQVGQIALAEYIDSMSAHLQRRQSCFSHQENIIAMCYIEMSRILAMPELPLDDRQKHLHENMDRIMHATEVILKMEDGEAKVKAIEDRFTKIWTIQIDGAKTEEEKKMLVSTLQQFKSTSPLTKGS